MAISRKYSVLGNGEYVQQLWKLCGNYYGKLTKNHRICGKLNFTKFDIFRIFSNPTLDFIICSSEKANQGNWPSHASSAKLATRQIWPHLLEMMQIGLKKWECGKNEGLTNSVPSQKTFKRVYKKILVCFTSSAFEVDSIISALHSVWK